MAIGRTFEEAIQKGLRMTGQAMHGFVGNKDIEATDYRAGLAQPTDMRIFLISQAMQEGWSVEDIHRETRIDRWFLEKLHNIHLLNEQLEQYDDVGSLPDHLMRKAKQAGFSDFQLARAIYGERFTGTDDEIIAVRKDRLDRKIRPVVKQIDTLAAEYPAVTNYLYITYNGESDDIVYEHDGKSVIVLGSGAYRIGSSVEFDWCSVNAIETVREEGYRSVMINYNPETVSTDYDICDRLYFDELSFERTLDIIELEKPAGTIVSVGGQIPNNLAMRLHRQGVRILGTSAESIDRAENRYKFSSMLDELGVDQPEWKELTSIDGIHQFTREVGFPVIVRPSYVLSGAAMNIVSNEEELEHFLELAAMVSKEYPVVVSRFMENTKEIEMDAVADHGKVIAYAISEHIEFAGVHSGDATMMFPPQKVYVETIRRIKKITNRIAEELNICGPFNIQYLARDNDIKVIECNLRASRSFPFVSKVLKTNFIELATRIMLGVHVEKPDKSLFELDYIGVKAPQFSFSRLAKADPVLGVDMSSTGEVGCIGEDYYEAILKSMLSVGYSIPRKNILLSTGPSRSKIELLNSARLLQENGYNLYATGGTANFLKSHHIKTTILHWPDSPKKPNTIDYIRERKIDLVINIPKNLTKDELYNDYHIRRAAVDHNIPLITNARLASAFIIAFCRYSMEDISIKSWDEY